MCQVKRQRVRALIEVYGCICWDFQEATYMWKIMPQIHSVIRSPVFGLAHRQWGGDKIKSMKGEVKRRKMWKKVSKKSKHKSRRGGEKKEEQRGAFKMWRRRVTRWGGNYETERREDETRRKAETNLVSNKNQFNDLWKKRQTARVRKPAAETKLLHCQQTCL